MKIVRHCRERLPGGERLWRRLANKAGFDGTLEVIGYGVGNAKEAVAHRRNVGTTGDITLAYIAYAEDRIRVFVDAPCSPMETVRSEIPLSAYAHELGHFVHNRDGTVDTERAADMYSKRMLKGLV